MTIIILVAALIAVLSLLFFLLASYEEYLDAREEEQQFYNFMEECFRLQNDSLEAYREMINTACHESGFWEVDDEAEGIDG